MEPPRKLDDFDQHGAEMDVDGPHQGVALPVVELLAEGVTEVLVGNEAMAAVDLVEEPGQSAGELTGCLPGKELEETDEDANQQIDGVIAEARALPGHSFVLSGVGRISNPSGARTDWKSVLQFYGPSCLRGFVDRL